MRNFNNYLLPFLAIIFLHIFTSCSKCDKSNDVVRNVPFKTFSKTLIPTLNGSIEFVSDSGKSIIFNDVYTNHEFNKYSTCMCFECCCHDYVNAESTRLVYVSSKENFNFQMYVGAGDSFDVSQFSMNSMSTNSANKYVSYLKYFEDENPEKLTTDSINNCKFLANKTLNGKAFNNVYSIQGTSTENMKYAKEVFYSTKDGIVAYILDDNSIWLKK